MNIIIRKIDKAHAKADSLAREINLSSTSCLLNGISTKFIDEVNRLTLS